MMSQNSEIPVIQPSAETKSWFNRKNIIILSVIIIFIVILAIIAFSGTNIGDIFIGWTKDYHTMFGALGVYLIIFLISTFANMTILFPIPYALALVFLGTQIATNPEYADINIWLLGIVAGSGAAIGEITAYYLGKGSAKLMESKESESIKKMKERIKRGYAVPLMFLCAATFIPDDPLLILLGYASYPLWKMLVTYFFGKITLCISTIYLTILAINVPLIQDFFWILGIPIEGQPPINPWISFVGWVGVLLLFVLIFFVDWGSKFKRLYGKLFKSADDQNLVKTNMLPFSEGFQTVLKN